MEKIESKPKDEQNEAIIKQLQDKVDELSTILGMMPGHVYWTDKKGVFRGCNQNLANFSNFSSRDEIVGKQLKELVPKHLLSGVSQTNHRVMEEGVPYEGEEVYRTDDSESIFLSKKVPLVNSKTQEITGLVGVSFDITDRKRMEHELAQAKAQAELANLTKNEFIRNMEHDIRTPLCGVASIASYLLSIEENPHKKEFLADLQSATSELLSYLDNIVEFSQLNTGTVPHILKEFNLAHLIASIFKLELAAAKDKGLELIIAYPDTIPQRVIGDRFRVQRIILNLVSNAIKFTHKGFVKVSVNILEKRGPNELLLEIAIEDTGIGIREEHQQVIYEKFHRCESSNKGIYKGTGLGLWVVSQYLGDLQGEIKLSSQYGKGSTFACWVPFRVS